MSTPSEPTWSPAGRCPWCGEAAHVYACPKPPRVAAHVWRGLPDDERLALEERAMRDKPKPAPEAAPPTTDFMSRLTNKGFYDDCKVTSEDPDHLTAHVDAVSLTFRRRLNGWEAEVNVDFHYGGARTCVYRGPATPELRALWVHLRDKAYRDQQATRDALGRHAAQILGVR